MQTINFKWNTKLKLQLIFILQKLIELKTKPTRVFVLGMHRSGTSCLTGMLGKQGLYLGDVDLNNPFNQKGNQESFLVNRYNEELFKINHGSWYDPKQIKLISESLKYQIEKYYLKVILDIVKNKRKEKMWLIKDPRLLFCLTPWRSDREIFIGTFRHPKKVASSLYSRAQKRQDETARLTLDDWEELWLKYNVELISLYEQKPFPIIDFDWEQQRYVQAVSKVIDLLGLNHSKDNSNFFDKKLINQSSYEKITNLKHQQLYDRLKKIAEIEEARNQLENVKNSSVLVNS